MSILRRSSRLHSPATETATAGNRRDSFLDSRPRRESNPHLRFRKPPFYPLNYGDSHRDQRSELSGSERTIRCRRSDFKSRIANERTKKTLPAWVFWLHLLWVMPKRCSSVGLHYFLPLGARCLCFCFGFCDLQWFDSPKNCEGCRIDLQLSQFARNRPE